MNKIIHYVSFNLLSVLSTIFAWGIIAYLAYRMYKKNPEQQVGWKAVIILIIGLVSFSITWTVSNTVIQIAVLPLGVWILYFILKRKTGRWERYRKFAWLGFGSNYIILLSLLLGSAIGHSFYPTDHAATFVSDVKAASILSIHPTGNGEATLKVETLKSELHKLQSSEIYDDAWYEDMFLNEKAAYERFPYLLKDAKPKWGSGVRSTSFVEKDGKGLLIQTPTQTLYFRSTQSFIEEDEEN
ncbi:hypothetical protein ABE021_01685 [Sporosarcina gallistercoris]|uniref:hypothetical protein n=1 Tax=Sporosarcina gallistercoris TaxID=2762245 RepID=UPI003D272F92